MSDELILFWKEIKMIQEYVVNVSLSKESKYDNVRDLLNDVTYETICKIMELLDGYRNNNLKGVIIDNLSNKVINCNIELHDFCEKFLNVSDI
ncbi:MAG: hypothetical protein NC253_03190 [Ruminococcus sp.]|nr:hypothetical protein [Ruminococcus sp.]MCM1381479.1 hypothetical protein [Muribaculaceae bacterium]MCM1480952.1 hypothetical protein [Muribaculaceae bacterium]